MSIIKTAVLATLLSLSSVTTVQAISSEDVDSAGFRTLTESQKAEIIKQVSNMSTTTSTTTSDIPVEDRVEKWVSIGANVGKGLAASAKEIGVTVNEFVKTPVGMLTTVLIVWNFIGSGLVHISLGMLFFIIGIYVSFRAFKPTVEILYDTTHKNIFGNYVVKTKTTLQRTDEQQVGLIIGTLITVAITCMTIFTGI